MRILQTIDSEIYVLNTDSYNNITITWNKMGSEFTYTIFFSKSSDGPWIQHNEIRLTDEIIDLSNGDIYLSLNQYVIDGLDKYTNYFIKIRCYDRYDSWWYSQSAYNSIEGGLGSSQVAPIPNNGNNVGFQFYIDTSA